MKLCWQKPFETSTAHERTEIIEGVLHPPRVDAHHIADKYKIASGRVFDRFEIFGKCSANSLCLLQIGRLVSLIQTFEKNKKGKKTLCLQVS